MATGASQIDTKWVHSMFAVDAALLSKPTSSTTQAVQVVTSQHVVGTKRVLLASPGAEAEAISSKRQTLDVRGAAPTMQPHESLLLDTSVQPQLCEVRVPLPMMPHELQQNAGQAVVQPCVVPLINTPLAVRAASIADFDDYADSSAACTSCSTTSTSECFSEHVDTAERYRCVHNMVDEGAFIRRTYEGGRSCGKHDRDC
jgi:hypothetical protein